MQAFFIDLYLILVYDIIIHIMTTLSVPIPSELEVFIQKEIEYGRSPNKAAVVRRALHRLAEEEAIQVVLQSEREVGEGKILRGDLRLLVKNLRK
ncbi:MAG: hypothetical protein Q8R17_02620 [bacterium]|nr:hypothetical protein [bacterium]